MFVSNQPYYQIKLLDFVSEVKGSIYIFTLSYPFIWPPSQWGARANLRECTCIAFMGARLCDMWVQIE